MTAAIAFLIVGLILLVYSADFLVKGAANIAAALGISPLIVGLTVVAFGTSAPELAVSVMSAYKGQADIALGNVVGSNIFNIVTVLGLSSIVAPAGISVAKQALDFVMLFMIAVALAALAVFFHGYRIGRASGIFFPLSYATYLAYLILDSTDHGALEGYRHVMLVFVGPSVGLALIVLLIRALRQPKNPA